MKLHGNTKKLEIIKTGWEERYKERKEDGLQVIREIEYPFYENNYLSGLRELFDAALEEEALLKENEKRFIPREKRNILAFIGRRGAGKTTAMEEFCRILSSLCLDAEKQRWLALTLEAGKRETLAGKRFYFHILDPIDASLLGEKEDLFELILVNIYRAFAGERNESGFAADMQKVELAERLRLIFERYFSVTLNDEEKRNWSVAGMMKHLASGYDVRKNIGEFIDDLLHLQKSRADYEYIVISIDDFDLNLRHGYEMLEQLQKYFSHHRLIILLTMDYNQMRMVCEEHFLREMAYLANVPESGLYQHCKALANDYMTKLFHFSQRMYMPDIKKLGSQVEIVIRKKDKDKNKNEIRIDMPVKTFLMCKVAELMHIYYDGCGLKRHFCETETVRDLVAYNEFLESLVAVDYAGLTNRGNAEENEVNREILRAYDQNHQRFNEDISIRLAQNSLLRDRRDAFEKLADRDLERRAMYFVNMSRSQDNIVFGDIDGKPYAYGDLLEKIYRWGRENLDDKPFISCVLASFTSEMVREYLHLRYNPDEERRKKYRKRLAGFLGGSFSNEWCGQALPEINIIINNVPCPTRLGYSREVSLEKLETVFELDGLEDLRKKNLTRRTGDKQKWKVELGKWMNKEHVLEVLQCLDMLFVHREGDYYQGINYQFAYAPVIQQYEKKTEAEADDKNAQKSADVQERYVIKVSGTGEAQLDVMGFVTKSLNYQREQERLESNIASGLADIIAEHLSMKAAQKDILKDILSEILREESEFGKCKGASLEPEVAFPFYDLDLAYNVWKRTRRSASKKKYREEELLVCLQDLYTVVESQLKAEDDFYTVKDLDDEEKHAPGYAKHFDNCPYIKMIRAIKDDEVRVNISSMLVTALKSAISFKVLPEDTERKAGT